MYSFSHSAILYQLWWQKISPQRVLITKTSFRFIKKLLAPPPNSNHALRLTQLLITALAWLRAINTDRAACINFPVSPGTPRLVLASRQHGAVISQKHWTGDKWVLNRLRQTIVCHPARGRNVKINYRGTERPCTTLLPPPVILLLARRLANLLVGKWTQRRFSEPETVGIINGKSWLLINYYGFAGFVGPRWLTVSRNWQGVNPGIFMFIPLRARLESCANFREMIKKNGSKKIRWWIIEDRFWKHYIKRIIS